MTFSFTAWQLADWAAVIGNGGKAQGIFCQRVEVTAICTAHDQIWSDTHGREQILEIKDHITCSGEGTKTKLLSKPIRGIPDFLWLDM